MNEILDALKAKYQGVSEAVLKVTANSMAKKGLSVTAVEETTIEQVVTAYGDYRATEAAKTALKTNEPKPQPATGGEPKPATEPKPAEETPEWVKALIAKTDTLSAELAALKGEKVATNRKTQLDATIAALPENLRAPYRLVQLDKLTDEEFTQLHESVKTQVTDIAAQVKASGVSFAAAPTTPGGTQVIEATPEQAAELIKEM